jgi:23S rRNA pseudouridine2605 synthase
MEDQSQRLQKYLSRCGVSSRRRAEDMMLAGRVEVNGEVVTELGTTVDPSTDRVSVDGIEVRPAAATVVVLMNKPRAAICSVSDPEGRPTVYDLLPRGLPRLFTVGRLDWDTQGVLLFTNDGELANALAHPRSGVTRVYHVKVRGVPADADIDRLRRGIPLDGVASPVGVHRLSRTASNTWFEVTLGRGRYHEVKRLFEQAGFPVQKLLRVSYAGLGTGGLEPGRSRVLGPDEVHSLRVSAGLARGRPRRTGRARQ